VLGIQLVVGQWNATLDSAYTALVPLPDAGINQVSLPASAFTNGQGVALSGWNSVKLLGLLPGKNIDAGQSDWSGNTPVFSNLHWSGGSYLESASLVAYYDFGDGDLANDSSTNAHALVLGGSLANVTTNADGVSAHFDGSTGSSYLQADLNANNTRYDEFTVSFWWKANILDQNTSDALISSIDNQSLNDWQIDDRGTAIRLSGDNDESLEVAQSSLASDTWYHTALVSDGSTVSFYITALGSSNVDLVGSVANVAFNLQDLRIGGNRVGNLTYDCDMAEIKVYNQTLSSNQLDELLYQGALELPANPNNAPVFTSDPILTVGAVEQSPYNGSLAGMAIDQDAGDILSYAKVSGPAWLSVASDGSLSGTPSSSDTGLNSFLV
ncbi:putative Ig domain-containing protein, partial [Pontiellaceae bacterium B12227]|nr:putative Ig domain-containing protein [Pontiellaceae bacterium B12227]